jgi:hypothetical protein
MCDCASLMRYIRSSFSIGISKTDFCNLPTRRVLYQNVVLGATTGYGATHLFDTIPEGLISDLCPATCALYNTGACAPPAPPAPPPSPAAPPVPPGAERLASVMTTPSG